nr:flavodoxin [uncultured Oscillibacter sp.]
MRNLKRLAALWMTAALILSLSVTAFAAVDDIGFSDVDADDWCAEAVQYCRNHGLMNGTSPTAFSPNRPMTRAMLAVVLYRIAGSPAVTGSSAFRDVADSDWCADAVIWANQNHIVGGYNDGTFRPNANITRQQIAAILWRYAGQPTADNGEDFADETSIAAYAADAVDWARENGIIAGMNGNVFAPNNNATRAQVATMLMRYTRLTASTPDNEESAPAEGARVLVAYFSGTGTTRGVARNLVAALGSDVAVLHEITPEDPYTAADLDYTNSNSRSVREQQDPDIRPAIDGSVNDMDQYDIVFLGYPIWNNDAPRIIYTFLESYDFGGKTIVPFCTSGGSGISNSVSNISGLASGATWLDGRRCNSSDSASTLASWANGLGLDFTPGTSEPDPTPAPQPTPEPEQGNRVLVAYFSATNNTEGVAGHISDALDADVYEIIPAVPYTSADLNYNDSSSRATVEMNDPNARPEISGSVDNMEDYDIIFLGYPIWWGQAPRIISTFLESYDFDGKTIVPFCTSASSGMGSSASNLHSLTDGATWLSGQRFSAGASRNTVVSWINGLGLDVTVN